MAIFATISFAISSAIVQRVNYWRFRSDLKFKSPRYRQTKLPVAYTVDLKSPQKNRA